MKKQKEKDPFIPGVTKTWTIKMILNADRTRFKIERVNDGFEYFELVGIIAHAMQELNLLYGQNLKPESTERIVIKQKPKP